MPVQLSIADAEKAISNRLIEYIETEYFGKTRELLSRCKETLAAPGTLFQKPYLEAAKAYQLAEGGIGNAKIPERIRILLQTMAEKDKGVFTKPYSHQIESLESFWNGYDVLVSTGTGSGKTECFMWPLVSKSHRIDRRPSVVGRKPGGQSIDSVSDERACIRSGRPSAQNGRRQARKFP